MTFLQDLITSLRSSLAGGDVVKNAIIAVVIVLVVGIIVGGVVYFTYLVSPKGRIDTILKESAARDRRSVWIARLALLPLVLIALIGTGSYMGRSSECGRCHGAARAAALARSSHRNVGCIACHGDQGLAGPVRQIVTYARWVSVYALTRERPKSTGADVDERACITCHQKIASSTVTRNGIRVRHSDFLAAGNRCADCHNAIAHPDVAARPSEPKMSNCLACHNGEIASTDCEVCHVRDPVLRRLPKGKGFAKVSLGEEEWENSCFKCHNPAPCTRCHGLRMPHPPGWARKGGADEPNLHARVAFTNRQVCWRCHFKGRDVFSPNPQACSACHEPGMATKMHGGPVWVQEHGLEAIGKKTGVFAACFACHSTTLCGDCHRASYSKRYRPKTGPDNYRRAVPLDPALIP